MPVSHPIESPHGQPASFTPGQPDANVGENAAINPASVETDDYPEVPARDTTALKSSPTGPAESESEETLWEGRYSLKNFVGRAIVGGLLVLAWVALATSSWGVPFWTYMMGGAVLIYWIMIGIRVLRTVRGHHYWLTNKRLFVATGLWRRRVDQVELVRIKDLYVKQSMVGGWLGIGNVIVISAEQTLPQAVLLGIEEPMRIMDLIWRATRAERDLRTTEINQI